jgi:hypothetical protein
MSGKIKTLVIALILTLSVVKELSFNRQDGIPVMMMAYSPFVVYSGSDTTQ